MNARLALFPIFLTLFSVLVNAENNHTVGPASDGQQVKVGWKAGPTQRGSLMLIYGCLSTIFASTWTVLHLNVPAPDDSVWTRGLRKVKWMAITILFPEFIFSKAVCELRLAVADLYSMHIRLKEAGFRWKTKVEFVNAEVYKEVTWKAEFGPQMRLLYRLLGLPRLPKVNRYEEYELQESSSAEGHGSVREAYLGDQRHTTENLALDSQEMKETRSFHDATENVEMISDGIDDYSVEPPHTENLATTGILSDQETDEVQAENSVKVIEGQDMISITRSGRREAPAPAQAHMWSETCSWTLVHSLYANMGGLLYIDSLSVSYGRQETHPATAQGIVQKCDDEVTCPLKDLVLKKEDIEDKSKADWLLKAIAISQILWLILNVATRGITKLPVTQLEIATVAFSLIAVATYAVNWWKPKDIVTPTTLKRPTFFSPIEGDTRNLQGFVKRLLAPSEANAPLNFYKLRERIENDIVWMQGDTPLIWGLMAISSLIFGGLHCLAWNFDFPTDTELVLWRVASLASSALPSFALGGSLLLGFLSTTFVNNMFISSLVSSLAPLEQFPPTWWDLLMQDPEFLNWPPESWFALRSLDPGTRDWDKAPNGLADLPPQADEITRDEQNWIKMNLGILINLRPWIVKAKEGRRDLDIYEKVRWGFWLFKDMDESIKAAELWDEYEEYLKTKLDPAVPSISTIHCLSFMVNMQGRSAFLEERSNELKRTCNQVSRVFTISIGILYTIARLTILVLLFTSLRAVPEGIYTNTSWPRFLPNIS